MTPGRYDIYIRSGGRWQRHESFNGDDKNSALAIASGMDASGLHQGVRVMAVTEYEGRPPLETLAWISPHLSKVTSVSRQMREQASEAERAVAELAGTHLPPLPESLSSRTRDIIPSDDTERPIARAKRRETTRSRQANTGALAGKLSLCGLVSLAVAAVVFVPLTALSEGIGARFGFGQDVSVGLAFVMSLLVFIILSAVLMRRIYLAHEPIYDIVTTRHRASSEVPRATITEHAYAQATPPTYSSTAAAPIASETPAPAEMERSSEDVAQALAEEHGTEQSEDPAEEPEKQQRKTGGLNQEMRRHMLKFLAAALMAIKDEVPKLNRHVQFGLNLFISGAAERYGKHSELTKMQAFVLVREMVEALGNSPDRVDAYCRQYAEYKVQDSYRMIIEAGHKTMDAHNAGDENPFANFSGGDADVDVECSRPRAGTGYRVHHVHRYRRMRRR